jgi:hypothetical protein
VVGLVNVILKHHPTIEDIISNILLLERDIQNPKKNQGHLPTPVQVSSSFK